MDLQQGAAGAVTPHSRDLDPLELAAASIGASDGAEALASRNGLLGTLRRLFAIGLPAPLSNPQLEAIRRLAIVARAGKAAAVRIEVNGAIAAGLTRTKVREVLRLHAPARHGNGAA
ncbi:hypothetical protein C7I55_03430 [Sphingomonas deserti]|uniref:Uncharacterized protein n=2 Tax=Allosphingosinicella deserti TaxID=2116704 RepID=A0A2P7QZN4_9SPHN|nr:hypothetical protein C7I55_03430 [Sphingomonas deserti]